MRRKLSEDQLDQLFQALSDQTRRKMLLRLAKQELCVSDLGQDYGLSKQLVSKHLKVLERAGLVSKQKDGRIQRCRFNPEAVEAAEQVVKEYMKFWEEQLDGLEKYIEQMKKEPER